MRSLVRGGLLLVALSPALSLAAQSVPSLGRTSAEADALSRRPSVSGHIRSLGGRSLPQNVLVRLENSTGVEVAQAWSGSSGDFVFPHVSAGNYVIVVDQMGYKPVRIPLQITMGPLSGLLVELEPEQDDAAEVPGAAVSLRQLQVPKKARKEFQEGLEAQSRHQTEQSAAHFRRAIELYPDFDDAYIQLALLHLQQGAYGEAQRVAEAALSVNDKNPQAYALEGVACRWQGNDLQAQKALEHSLQLDERSWFAHLELGRVYLRQRQLEAGYQHISRAHALNPGVPSVHLSFYNTLLLRHKTREALAELDEFLRLFPDHHLAAKVRERRQSLTDSLAQKQP